MNGHEHRCGSNRPPASSTAEGECMANTGKNIPGTLSCRNQRGHGDAGRPRQLESAFESSRPAACGWLATSDGRQIRRWRFVVIERIVVPIPASTEIYVILENKPNNRQALQHQSAKPSPARRQRSNCANWLAGKLRRFLAFPYNQAFCSPRLHVNKFLYLVVVWFQNFWFSLVFSRASAVN